MRDIYTTGYVALTNISRETNDFYMVFVQKAKIKVLRLTFSQHILSMFLYFWTFFYITFLYKKGSYKKESASHISFALAWKH